MTNTVQFHSSILLDETGKELAKDKVEMDDNLSLMLSVYDKLNQFCEALNRLDYVIDKYNIMQANNNKGETK